MNARAMPDAVSALMRRFLVGIVRGYRLLLSPWIGAGCRFEPTCSLYAIEAIERHGPAAGSYLAARRILRCHPGCAGGCDPVPERWNRRGGASSMNSSSPEKLTP